MSDVRRRETVAEVAASLLGATVTELPAAPAQGFGYETWVVSLGGHRFVVRVAGPGAELGKLRAAWRAHRLAWAAGVPTGQPVCMVERCAELEGRALRIVRFVEGGAPQGLSVDPEEHGRMREIELAAHHALGMAVPCSAGGS